MAAALESIIATRKFARVLGDETDPTELSLEAACKWAREVLNSYKLYVEKASEQNVFELVTPEALETLQEVLLATCEYKLETEYPTGVVATGGTPAQKAARREWIMEWLGGLMSATSSAASISFLQALREIPECRPTGAGR